MNKKIFFILTIIILIASILRLWKLDGVPISPDWDEVSLGYNAYSILQTGKDEYGQFLPVVLRSYDDYKPALYAYFAIPPVAVFGLNVFAVRLPSAIFGILTVLATYFLVKELFKRNDVALISSFLLAISPWHIQFSRIAFESNVGLAFNVFTILFFLKGLKKPWFLALSSFLAGVNIYIYQSEKVFTPLMILALAIIYRNKLFSLPRKYIFTSLIIGFFIILPMLNFTLSNKNSLERAKRVSIFSQNNKILESNSIKILEDTNSHDLLGLIIDNRRFSYAKEIISGYLSHFDLNWFFTRGDIARHHAVNMGLVYLFEFPFILIGIYSLLFGSFDKKTKLAIFAWFLIAPIPASITTGVPHAVRTLNFLPTFQIFISLGILSFLSKIRYTKYMLRFSIYTLFSILAIYNVFYYLDQYFVQQNYFVAKEWQYGYADAVPTVKKIEGNYKKIVVSNQPPMDQSYMFFLFYLNYPPQTYQKDGQYSSGGFRENHTFGKFEFRPIEWNKEEKSDTLFVGRPTDFPVDISLKKEVFYPDGNSAMKVITKY